MKSRFSKMVGLTFSALMILTLALARPAGSSQSSIAVGTVTQIGSMHVARASHTATLLPNGKVLIAGGFAGSGAEGSPYASAEIYDPASGRFTPTASMTARRSGHTATQLKNGKILITGGWTGRYDAHGTAELFDPATEIFTPTGSMVVQRAGNTATLLPDGKVLVAGGVDRNENALASAEIYNPATGLFTLTGNMSQPRGAHTATLLKNGKVLIAGGGSGHYPSETVYRSAELYDPATGAFTPAGEMTVVRHKHAAVLLPNGKVLVVGGSNNRDWRGEYSSAELYDPAHGTFQATGSMSLVRFKLPSAAVLLHNGKVLVAGGGERAEVYDPATEMFSTAAGNLGAARFFASATLLANGQALITGGYFNAPDGGLPSTANAWIYEP